MARTPKRCLRIGSVEREPGAQALSSWRSLARQNARRYELDVGLLQLVAEFLDLHLGCFQMLDGVGVTGVAKLFL